MTTWTSQQPVPEDEQEAKGGWSGDHPPCPGREEVTLALSDRLSSREGEGVDDVDGAVCDLHGSAENCRSVDPVADFEQRVAEAGIERGE